MNSTGTSIGAGRSRLLSVFQAIDMNRLLSGLPITVLALLPLFLLLGCEMEGAQPAQAAGAAAEITNSADALSDTIDLRKIGYSQGRADAPVTVIEFSDFGCPFCAMFSRGSYPQIQEEFIATGAVRWVYVPFVMGMFPNGDEAARAAECAAEQDAFGTMKDRIYAGQNEWKSSRRAAPVFAQYARELELDDSRFDSCYRQDRGGERTRANNRAAAAVGVRATPTFVINGRIVEGALPLEAFRQVLAELARE